MGANALSLRLLSVAMVEDEPYQMRQGFWLRMARERAGKSQAGAAAHLGLSGNSKSSVSDYENGVTAPSLRTLRRLAAWYQVPLSVFTEPELTALERLDALAAEAEALAREDTAQEAAPGHGAGAPRVA